MNKKIVALLLLGLLITVMWSFFGTYTGTKAPILCVGDQWTYLEVYKYGKSCRTEIIDRIEDFEGAECYVRIQNCLYIDPAYEANTVWITSDWVVLKIYMQESIDFRYFTTYYPGWKLYDFPLTVGKEWGEKSHGTESYLDADGEIMGTGYPHKDWIRSIVSTETVTVPVGTFDTYVIEELMMGNCKRFWFSEDVKNYVKMEILGENNSVELTKVLTSYELAPQENEQGNLLLLITLSAAIGVLGITSLIYHSRNKETII
jgi:hypothetical protein